MNIEQRGIPPYTIMSSGSSLIEAHPGYRENFLGALEVIFDLTDAGLLEPGPRQTTPNKLLTQEALSCFLPPAQRT